MGLAEPKYDLDEFDVQEEESPAALGLRMERRRPLTMTGLGAPRAYSALVPRTHLPELHLTHHQTLDEVYAQAIGLLSQRVRISASASSVGHSSQYARAELEALGGELPRLELKAREFGEHHISRPPAVAHGVQRAGPQPQDRSHSADLPPMSFKSEVALTLLLESLPFGLLCASILLIAVTPFLISEGLPLAAGANGVGAVVLLVLTGVTYHLRSRVRRAIAKRKCQTQHVQSGSPG